MATTPPSQPPPDSGGIHIGDVGGSVSFSALGDIVGGDKITTITTTIQISVEAITQRPLITTSPYRGLDRFEDRDKDLFFGRDQLIKSQLAQLSGSNVLLVLGASGSGKSSVVRAGLLPQLSQLIGARFRYFTFVPDVNPFESLRSALQGAGFSQAQTRELAEAKPETPAKLIHALQRSGDQWLFFVDQFEEIFTVGDEKLRASFIAALVQIAQDLNSSTKLVLAMRADFLDRFSPFPQFAKIIEKNIDFVADMHADELRLAIEQPAARHGVVFEQGLVEEIIKDVQGQAGSLPLLQYTLDLLWQEEARDNGLADRHLNTQTYRELGGVRGALQKRANEIYASFGDGTDAKAATPKQEIVRQIFLRLVDLAGEGSNDAAWRPVRRRASMAIFTTAPEQEFLQALINQKLLVSNREGDDATVEVAHEALFTSWGRLKNWIESGKQVIFAKNRLADDARRWKSRQQEGDTGGDEELLSGSRLAQALDMRARGDFVTVIGGLAAMETQFLDASLALRDRRTQEERVRQQRELEAAQRLAAVQQIAAGRLRKGLAVAVVLLISSIAGAYFGWVGQRTAQQAAKKTETVNFALTLERSATKAALSRSDRETAVGLSGNQQPAAAIAYLARSLENDPENRAALADVLTTAFDTSWLIPAIPPVHLTSEISDVLFSPDATRILVRLTQPQAGEEKFDWQLYSKSDSNEIRLVADLGGAKDLGFSSDGSRILELSAEGQPGIARWDSVNGATVSGQLVLERYSQKSHYRAKFRPHARPGAVEVVDAGDTLVGAPLYHALAIGQAWVSPDGRHAVTFEMDSAIDMEDRVYIWRLGHYYMDRAQLLRGSTAYARSVRFSPGGHYVTLGLNNGEDKPDSSELYRLDLPADFLIEPVEFFADLRVADFSADGRFAISAHAEGLLQLWNLADPPPAVIEPRSSNVTDPRFEAVASLGDRGSAEGLDPAALATLDLPIPADTPTPIYDGWTDPSHRFILFQAERSWQLWDAKTRHRTMLNVPVEAPVDSFLFSRGDRWLAFQVLGGTKTPPALHLIALETGVHQERFVRSDHLVFSKSGRFLLTLATYDGQIRVFDTATLELCATYRNPIQDKFWATEKILELQSTRELCAVLTALGGKRLAANGAMENVPPTEWLRLRTEVKPGASFANAMVRWILDWPKDRLAPPF
jgi:WD40 repeat protein